MNIRRAVFLVSSLLVGAALLAATPGYAGIFNKKPKTPPLPPLPPPMTNVPPPVTNPPPVVDTPPPPPAPKGEFAWDATVKEVNPHPGEANAATFFTVTNISKDADAVITVVRPSCGCTTAKVPPLPWTIPPGKDGRMDFSVNLAGKSGTLFKTVTVESSAGNVTLQIKINVPDVAVMRESNMQAALGDRQAVFKNDCASCHVTPAVGKMGAELFKAACSICHESPNRATMVPDLHKLNHPTDRDYWKVWITYGKPGSLMPGFAKSQDGGYLTDEQIDSLADYLTTAIPSRTDLAPMH